MVVADARDHEPVQWQRQDDLPIDTPLLRRQEHGDVVLVNARPAPAPGARVSERGVQLLHHQPALLRHGLCVERLHLCCREIRGQGRSERLLGNVVVQGPEHGVGHVTRSVEAPAAFHEAAPADPPRADAASVQVVAQHDTAERQSLRCICAAEGALPVRPACQQRPGMGKRRQDRAGLAELSRHERPVRGAPEARRKVVGLCALTAQDALEHAHRDLRTAQRGLCAVWRREPLAQLCRWRPFPQQRVCLLLGVCARRHDGSRQRVPGHGGRSLALHCETRPDRVFTRSFCFF